MGLSADINTLLTYFPSLDAAQITQLHELGIHYKEWNQRVNLISRKDIDHLYTRHVLHSLSIAKVISFQAGARILDFGTGGGFPGIPLAILFPETRFVLVDSVGKKIRAVQDIAQKTGLANVSTFAGRGEDMGGGYDFVVARAVTRLDLLYGWVRDKLSATHLHTLPNGLLYLKGGELREELSKLALPYRTYAIARFFAEPFFTSKYVVYLSPHRF